MDISGYCSITGYTHTHTHRHSHARVPTVFLYYGDKFLATPVCVLLIQLDGRSYRIITSYHIPVKLIRSAAFKMYPGVSGMEVNTRFSVLLRPGSSFGRMASHPLGRIRHCNFHSWIAKIGRFVLA